MLISWHFICGSMACVQTTMKKYLTYLLIFMMLSCQADHAAETNKFIAGAWDLEEVSFWVNGKNYKVPGEKLYQSNYLQVEWLINEDNTMTEKLSNEVHAHRFKYSEKNGEFSFSGYHSYESKYKIIHEAGVLKFSTHEWKPAHYVNDNSSFEGVLQQDAYFLLDGQLSKSAINEASTIRKSLLFKRIF